MKAFCVECGKEGMVYQGLCKDCLPKRRRFVETPSFMDLHQCVHCGNFDLPGGWREASVSEAVKELVSSGVKVPREVQGHTLKVGHTSGDGDTIPVLLRATLRLGGLVIREERHLDIRIRRTTCPQCSRERGGYYEAILQVRGDGRDLTEQEVEEVRRVVYSRAEKESGLYVSQEQSIHGGLDLYLSSNRSARALVRELKTHLGGQVSTSPQLHTKKKGKDVYRVTHLLRLPGH